MAEGIVAFSLAAGVVQFVDFGSRVTSNFWGYYRAHSENEDDAPNVEILLLDLENVLKELQNYEQDGDQSSFTQLAKECHKAAAQLRGILEPMVNIKKRHHEDEKRRKEDEKRQHDDAKTKGRTAMSVLKSAGKRTALKAALKLAWKENQISSLKSQIDQFRSQLTLHLLTSLR
jgi:hypothetical protein